MNEEVVVFLRGRIEDFQSKMKTASGEIDKVGKKGGGAFQKLASVGQVAFAGLAGGAVAVGAFSLKMADDFEQAHARLETAIKNTGSSFDAYRNQVQTVDSRLEKFGFTNADVEGNLSTLVNATHNTKQALSDMSLAADIARGRHISLQEATGILAKVETGHVALLGRLGIQTKDATGKTISQQEAVKRLAAMYGGQAAASAKTFSGQMTALKTEAVDLGAKIGVKLIPIIQTLMRVTGEVVNWFEKHKTAAAALAVVIGGVLVGATAAWVVSLFAADGALAFLISPIVAVVAGVALLAAGIIYLWTHWDQVWNWIMHHKAYAIIIALVFPIIAQIVALVGVIHWFYTNWDSIWSAASNVIRAVWNVIGPTILAIGRVVMDIVHLVNALIHGDWSAAWDAAKRLVADAFLAMYHWVVDVGGQMLSWLGSLGGKIIDAFAGAGSWLIHAGEQLIQGLINGIKNAAGGIVGAIEGSLPGPIKGALHVIGLASGGIVNKPTLAVVGEAGPEAVVPLRGLATRGVTPLPATSGARGGGNNYTIYVNVPPNANLAAVGQETVKAIKQYELRAGSSWRS